MAGILDGWSRPAPDDDFDRMQFSCIDRHGVAVTSVFDPAGKDPAFAYPAGVLETLGAPELIVIGLDGELMQGLIVSYAQRIRDGETFTPGVEASGFLTGFKVRFVDVDASNPAVYSDYMRWTVWYYGRRAFPARQLVWPFKVAGCFPWDLPAGDPLRAAQPVLGSVPAV